jgi:hypothetical protein
VYEILASRHLRERLARRARARAERCDWAHETQGLVMQYRKTQVLAAHRGRASRLLRAML